MKKLTIIIIVAAVIGCALGYAVGYSIGGKDVTAFYATKIAAVNKIFPTSTQTLSLNGQVKSIIGNTVTIDANSVTVNPFAKGNTPSVRDVTVTSATAITRMEQKSPDVFQKEMTVFQNATKQGSTATSTVPVATPPMPFSETVIKISDIKVGDIVMVTASSDISSSTSFSATKIQVMPASPAVRVVTPDASATTK